MRALFLLVMLIMGLDLMLGLGVTTVNLIIALEMALPCVFLLVHGSWMPEQAVSQRRLM